MKFIFKIGENNIEKTYDNTTTLLDIKKDLLENYYENNEECKYLDFELILNKPIKYFSKLSLEPGLIPSTMDKYKLNNFSIQNIKELSINVIENNTKNILDDNINIQNNISINEKINNKINNYNKNNVKNNKKYETTKFNYNINDFPELGS